MVEILSLQERFLDWSSVNQPVLSSTVRGRSYADYLAKLAGEIILVGKSALLCHFLDADGAVREQATCRLNPQLDDKLQKRYSIPLQIWDLAWYKLRIKEW